MKLNREELNIIHQFLGSQTRYDFLKGLGGSEEKADILMDIFLKLNKKVMCE